MLTKKQYQLFDFIKTYQDRTGVAPSYEEMKEALNLKSKSGVAAYIQALIEKNYIRKLTNKARAIEILKGTEAFHKEETRRFSGDNVMTGGTLSEAFSSGRGDGSVQIALHGSIAAGLPLEVFESIEETVEIPEALLNPARPSHDYFALKIVGLSMIEAGILDGDVVILEKTYKVASGDIIAALVDSEEVTLKKIYFNSEDRVTLAPANRDFVAQEYAADRINIIGKLAGLLRNY